MAGDLVSFDLALEVKKQAAIERDRIAKILAAIDEVAQATAAAQAEGLSEAGETLAVDRMIAAETELLKLVLDPGFAAYAQHLLRGLTSFAGGAA